MCRLFTYPNTAMSSQIKTKELRLTLDQLDDPLFAKLSDQESSLIIGGTSNAQSWTKTFDPQIPDGDWLADA